jgi:hypothetical protein
MSKFSTPYAIFFIPLAAKYTACFYTVMSIRLALRLRFCFPEMEKRNRIEWHSAAFKASFRPRYF